MKFSRCAIDALALAGVTSAILLTAVPAMAQSANESHMGIPIDKIGLVSFTIRSQLGEDARTTLQAVTACGVKSIEFSSPKLDEGAPSFAGVEVPALKAFSEEFGFTVPSLGVNGADLTERLDIVVDAAKTLGASYVRISGVEEVAGEAPEAYYSRLASALNEAGAALKAEGITLAYHNHDAEFEKLADGRSGYDILLAEVKPEAAAFELDLYWAVNGAADPLKLIQENPGRFPLYHVKDAMRVTENGVESVTMTTVGQGFIDFQPIFDLDDISGVQHYFIENDRPLPDGVTSACEGYTYLASATDPK